MRAKRGRVEEESDLSSEADEVVVRPPRASKASSTSASARNGNVRASVKREGKIVIPDRYMAQFPIEADASLVIGNLAKDYDSFRSSYDIYLELATEAAVFLEESFEAEDKETTQPRTDLEEAIKKLIDEKSNLDVMKNGLKELEAQVKRNRGTEVMDLRGSFEGTYVDHMQKQAALTARQKYKDSKIFKKFIRTRHDAQGIETPAPLPSDLLPRESGDGEDSGSEVEGGEVEQNLKCPITMTWLQNPVKTSNCPHAFSKDAINELLKQSAATGQALKCPNRGCKGVIKASDLYTDKALEKDVERAKQREETAKEKTQNDFLQISSSDDDD